MLDEQQIQARMPLWEALSSLWLDTEVTAEELEWIGQVMADSGLTIDEVAPVVYMNVYSVAGQWMGFSPDWLRREIVRNLRDRPRRTRFCTLFPITRCLMLSQTDAERKKLVAIVRRRREEHAAVPST